jgi:hypothetical protein
VAGAAAPDALYRDAKLASHPLATVALLPVVSVVDDPAAERLVEASWIDLYRAAGTTWMPAVEVRAGLARAMDGDLGAEIDAQIWRRGGVDPAVAGRLARLLGVDAVLSVRIDRWEIADGDRAMVELTATLSGADGSRLWSISGLAGCGVPHSSTGRNFNADMSWIRDPRLEPRELDREKLGGALYTLLARWEPSLPVAPLYAHDGESSPVEQESVD